MGSALAKSKHAFFMAAMVDHGIASRYLTDVCDKKDYKICTYKDSLPDRAYKFLWEENSPFYKLGGWKGTKEEFNEIIWETLTTPEYILLHIKESLKATSHQLTLFSIGDGTGPFPKGTKLYERLEKNIPGDKNAYLTALQNNGRLLFISWFNILLNIITILGVAALTALLYFWRRIGLKIRSQLFTFWRLSF